MSIDSTMKQGGVDRRSRSGRVLITLASVVLMTACSGQGEQTASTDSAALATANQAKMEAEQALATAQQSLQAAQQAQAAVSAANERSDRMYQQSLKK